MTEGLLSLEHGLSEMKGPVFYVLSRENVCFGGFGLTCCTEDSYTDGKRMEGKRENR
jgi:hypothetical protein